MGHRKLSGKVGDTLAEGLGGLHALGVEVLRQPTKHCNLFVQGLFGIRNLLVDVLKGVYLGFKLVLQMD